MPDFRDNFTAREVCEGMLGQINVALVAKLCNITYLPQGRVELHRQVFSGTTTEGRSKE